MRILTVTSSYPKYPGDTTAPFVESITRSLAERGHQLEVVLPARGDLSPAAPEGVIFHPYRYAPSPGLAVFGYAESLRADVAVRPSVYLVAPLALASGAAKLASLARRGDFDVLHAHWVVPNGAMALAARWLGRLPLVVSLHGSDLFLAERGSPFRLAARLALRRAAAVTASSEDLARRSRVLGAPDGTEVIPYGVDTGFFRPNREAGARLRVRLGLLPGQPVVLAVGRLVHKKGFEVLVDATPRLLAREPGLRVIIAGRGDLERSLAERAARLRISQAVLLLGNVPRGELPSYYAAATAVVVPSVHDPAGNVDGLPNVVLEAMASGAPLVASSVGGIPQAVVDGREGFLVPERDPEALAAAVLELVGSPEKREALGRAARARAKVSFGWEQVGQKFEALFSAVAGARGKKA